jgi:hypothetical protein
MGQILRRRPLVGRGSQGLRLVRHLKSGALDHVPTDLPDRVAPKLFEHYERIKRDPRIKAYYAKHRIAS